MSSQTVVVLFGAPAADIDAYAEQLVANSHALYLGELNIAYGDTVDELLQVYELSQVSLHEPLFAALRRWAGHADPRGFLQANRHWTLAELLRHLITQTGATSLVLSDINGGKRIAMIDRWLEALPQAVFVHTTIELSKFEAAAQERYAGRLFIPPDYLDHSDSQPAPCFVPALGWFQIHTTLAYVLGERLDRQTRRIALDRKPPASIADLLALARADAPSKQYSNIDELKCWLGYP